MRERERVSGRFFFNFFTLRGEREGEKERGKGKRKEKLGRKEGERKQETR